MATIIANTDPDLNRPPPHLQAPHELPVVLVIMNVSQGDRLWEYRADSTPSWVPVRVGDWYDAQDNYKACSSMNGTHRLKWHKEYVSVALVSYKYADRIVL